MAVAPEDGAADHGFATDPAVRPHDRGVDHRRFVDVRLTPDYLVGEYLRARLDDDAFVDDAPSADYVVTAILLAAKARLAIAQGQGARAREALALARALATELANAYKIVLLEKSGKLLAFGAKKQMQQAKWGTSVDAVFVVKKL